MRCVVLAALATSLLPLIPASGQACLGLASLEKRPTNLTVGATFTNGAKGLDARFGFGQSIAFGGVSASILDYNDIDGTSKGVGADGGLSFITGSSRKAMVCPVASIGYVKHPDIVDVSLSSTGAAAGIAVGVTMTTTSALQLIPFGVIQAAYERVSGSGYGSSDSASDTYGVLSGGLSFVLSEGFLIRPLINIPLGLEGADPSYGVGVSFSFGKK